MTACQESACLKFPQEPQEIFARAETARDQGRLEDAARLFGRSAADWGATGMVFHAIDAYFELGAVLLLQGRGGLLGDLADRLLELLKHRPLPPGSHLKLRVFADLMRIGATTQGAFFCLVHEQRRHRAARGEHDFARQIPPDPRSLRGNGLDMPKLYLDQVVALLRTHVPHAEVWAYGSRVSGGGHEASDLDLVLRNPANPAAAAPELFDLIEALVESNLPIRVDILDWARIPESFHREIESAHVVLQAGDEGAGA